MDSFEARAAALERALPQARLGVAVKDLKTGQVWQYRGGERFPLQSVFKLPLAWAVMREVDRGKMTLDGTMLVRRQDMRVPTTVLDNIPPRGRRLKVREMLEMSVQQSDNTSTDLLMERIGGPLAITRALGVPGLRIDRYEYTLQRDSVGLAGYRGSLATEEAFNAALARVPRATKLAQLGSYLKDPRDTSTPNAMVAFLERFAKGEGLRPATQKALMKIAEGTTTGAGRLQAGLPKGTVWAHKTGTGRTIEGRCSAVNDVGIATLPDGRRLVVVAFLSGARGTVRQREATLASIARLAVEFSAKR
jgi:beta-lactamase class A